MTNADRNSSKRFDGTRHTRRQTTTRGEQGAGETRPFLLPARRCAPRAPGGVSRRSNRLMVGNGTEGVCGAVGVVVRSVESGARKRADPVGPTLSLTASLVPARAGTRAWIPVGRFPRLPRRTSSRNTSAGRTQLSRGGFRCQTDLSLRTFRKCCVPCPVLSSVGASLPDEHYVTPSPLVCQPFPETF